MDDQGGERFRDTSQRLWSFLGEVQVRCPRCEARAWVRPVEPGDDPATAWRSRRRVVCPGCAYADAWPPPGRTSMTVDPGGSGDPYFGLPLWLATDCRGHVLWAYNLAHVDLLEAHVAARLRERGGAPGLSMLERLPTWMTAAGHRADVLRALGRLRELAR